MLSIIIYLFYHTCSSQASAIRPVCILYTCTVLHEEEDSQISQLTGPVADQAVRRGLVCYRAAPHGLLAKLRDLGLPLLSVNRVESGKVR